MTLEQHLNQFQSKVVRDLAWSLLSPPLLSPPKGTRGSQQSFFATAFNSVREQLIQLDQHDEELVEYLAESNDYRLGVYFEKLWQFFLKLSPQYTGLGHNIAVREYGRTLGEFDLIVYDQQSNETEHWELAVKFYLGLDTPEGHRYWFGPNLHDRLDKKYRHLENHQLRLSRLPAAQTVCQQNGWTVSGSRLISKGRLFYPSPTAVHEGQNPAQNQLTSDHEQGQWWTWSGFHDYFKAQPRARFLALEKTDWMVIRPNRQSEFVPLSGLQAPRNPQQVLISLPDDHHKVVFLVADDWPDKALQQINNNNKKS